MGFGVNGFQGYKKRKTKIIEKKNRMKKKRNGKRKAKDKRMKKKKKIAGKRKEKENREKRKENEKSYNQRLLKITAGSSIATTGGLRQEPPVLAPLPAV